MLLTFSLACLWLSITRLFPMLGDPIPVAELQRFGSLHEQALEVRKKAYFLEKTLAGPNQNR